MLQYDLCPLEPNLNTFKANKGARECKKIFLEYSVFRYVNNGINLHTPLGIVDYLNLQSNGAVSI
jgi:hypothetical protein